MRLVEAFSLQAEACGQMGSPMYADLCRLCAQDAAAGGPVAQVLAGHEDVPGRAGALALRLLGSVHRLVLQRSAGALAAYYPSVGGTWSAPEGWLAFLSLLRESPDAVREWLDRPPQTNEVGRAAALYGGLLHLPAAGFGGLPVRLLEIGCSAGLNLRADRFGYLDAAGRPFGAPEAELVLGDAWRGRRLEAWPGLRVAERTGCDTRPVDPGTTEGRLVLTAYVWPDQRERLDRLRAALRVAQTQPAVVRQQDARSFLAQARLVPGQTTVLWHSVMWQYLTREDQAACAERIDELGAAAHADQPFVHLRCEPDLDADAARFLVRLQAWPGGEDRLVAETVGHGLPTTWL